MLQLHQDAKEGTAHFTSLTECILKQPMLSFSVYQSKAIKKSADEHEEEQDGEDDEDKDVMDFVQNGAQFEDDNETACNDESAAETPRDSYQVSLKMFGIHVK